jgi:hypothetical protein
MTPAQQLWIDDLRPAPEGWLWAKTPGEAIAILSSPDYDIRIISFDHDLGLDDQGKAMTSEPVVDWIELRAARGEGPRIEWAIHSMNPEGRRYLELGLLSCNRFWNLHNK